ncbi:MULTISPECIES: replication endonuclease [Pseudomonas putida group]|uniref:replication endonuclease n=1 Tax=Pseudomonas putida group TaxID=136845 RepID=UPI00064C84EE|nr:replication endonuclease [Pseudomonas putida]
MREFRIQEISVIELSTFDTGQLRKLARQIADSHLEYIAQASPVSLTNHVGKPHEFGVALDDAKGKTDEGKCQRLCDPGFWFGRLTQIADKARESIAVRSLRLGDPALGLEPYCSDESLSAYINRQAGRSVSSLRCLQREIEKAAHGSYLLSKALCERAFAAGHLSVLITLGLDGRFHSSSSQYQGFAFDDAHAALHGLYEPLLDGLSRLAIRGVDFYGARCIEVHADGCPHWHLVIYLRPDLLPYLIERLRALHYKQSTGMGEHFDAYSGRIVQVQQPTDLARYSAAVSYIFKNSYAGRAGDDDQFMAALRQKVAISIHGKRQYDFIGMSGSRSVIRELRKCQSVGGVANELVLGRDEVKREERQYSAIKSLVDGELDSYRLLKDEAVNCYGETVTKIIGVCYLGGSPGKEELVVTHCPGVICNDSRVKRCEGDIPVWCPILARDFNCWPRAPPDITVIRQL